MIFTMIRYDIQELILIFNAVCICSHHKLGPGRLYITPNVGFSFSIFIFVPWFEIISLTCLFGCTMMNRSVSMFQSIFDIFSKDCTSYSRYCIVKQGKKEETLESINCLCYICGLWCQFVLFSPKVKYSLLPGAGHSIEVLMNNAKVNFGLDIMSIVLKFFLISQWFFLSYV
jgi:hypothetical protein